MYERGYALLSPDDRLRQGIEQDPIIALVDDLLYDAIAQAASDIHIQPHENAIIVRNRVDGVLYDQRTIEHAQAAAVVSRIKVLSGLDIAQRRLPQDGHFKLFFHEAITDRFIDFRVATFPAMHGEKIVVRLFDRAQRLLALDNLGLESIMYASLTQLMRQPHGLFLVTGPTGCGKTTMLYALISYLNQRTSNIITIEDPIEYELAGITQSQINNKAGFTFGNGLRALLRQDPDIIMIGEIRDHETARIAVEAALTGHLVLSTLHTNDAPSAVTRLIDMGIEPFLLSATLQGVLAQRLVRRLCDRCKKNGPPAQHVQQLAHNRTVTTSYSPQGCVACSHRGYKGRLGVFELLTITDQLRSVIADPGCAAKLANYDQAYTTLLDDGIAKVNKGLTALDEIVQLTVSVSI
jgi:type II secretory ATPase GspE/PulE/Tfp pilus assembly ATPase PilB-like protein